MSYSPLLIHIGYPKTGSTWLQQVIFKNQSFSFHTPWELPSHKPMIQLTQTNPCIFSASSVYESLLPGLEIARKNKKIAVLSHEMLSGDQVSGQYWGKEVADKLYQVFPEAKILICIREQKSMILSSYREYIRHGGTVSLEAFVGSNRKQRVFKPILKLDYLKYHGLVNYYQKIFGSEQVLTLPFELLKVDQNAFLQTLLNFLNLPIDVEIEVSSDVKNKGFKAARLVIQRQLNHFFQPEPIDLTKFPPRSSQSWLVACKVASGTSKLIPSKVNCVLEEKWKDFIDERVGDFFLESNKITGKSIGFELKKLGYNC